jgi:hypothetical protein
MRRFVLLIALLGGALVTVIIVCLLHRPAASTAAPPLRDIGPISGLDPDVRDTLERESLGQALIQLLRARQVSRSPVRLDEAIRIVLRETCGGLDTLDRNEHLRLFVHGRSIEEIFPPEYVPLARTAGCGVLFLHDGREIRTR